MVAEYHIVQSFSGKWVVRRKYARRSTKAFLTKRQAINWAERRCATLFIHGYDGRIESIRHASP